MLNGRRLQDTRKRRERTSRWALHLFHLTQPFNFIQMTNSLCICVRKADTDPSILWWIHLVHVTYLLNHLSGWLPFLRKRARNTAKQLHKHINTHVHTSSSASNKIRCWSLTSHLDYQLRRQGEDLPPVCVCVRLGGFVELLTPGLCQSSRFFILTHKFLVNCRRDRNHRKRR